MLNSRIAYVAFFLGSAVLTAMVLYEVLMKSRDFYSDWLVAFAP